MAILVGLESPKFTPVIFYPADLTTEIVLIILEMGEVNIFKCLNIHLFVVLDIIAFRISVTLWN